MTDRESRKGIPLPSLKRFNKNIKRVSKSAKRWKPINPPLGDTYEK